MTATQFRRIALSLPEVEEHSHMQHPDFRIGGKVFATLGYPDKGWGMVKLTPEQQRIFVQEHPGTFKSVNGTWGLQGNTLVQLKAADEEMVQEALKLAWRERAPRKNRGTF